MIDEPALCMGALWIPYRREAGLMRRVLKTPTLGTYMCIKPIYGVWLCVLNPPMIRVLKTPTLGTVYSYVY
jgi:hypothetical protein